MRIVFDHPYCFIIIMYVVDHPVALLAQVSCDSQSLDSDGERELDLLYDPVLNYYYDPASCKYYELK